MKTPILILAFIALLTGCAELERLAGSQRPLTEQEVISGLRQALVVGSDSAASRLGRLNGYYEDPLVHIPLPPEAAVITDNLSLLPGGNRLVEDVILRINRAAEEAAREAAPIFARAVSGMSIQDGFDILRGESDAATQYLKANTYEQLSDLYNPRIRQAIDATIVGNVSAAQAWDALTGQWNNLARSTPGRIANLRPVDIPLDDYLTRRALDGLFLKLAMEEEKIRTDPAARVTALLQRVFGSRAES